MSQGSKMHEMRVTSQGKIQSYVSFALAHLQDATRPPLLLHTLPLSIPQTDMKKLEGIARSSVDAIPKLVSVVEIVKREYEASFGSGRSPGEGKEDVAGASGSRKGKRKREDGQDQGEAQEQGGEGVKEVTGESSSRASGHGRLPHRLHQYNELSFWETVDLSSQGKLRTSSTSKGKGKEKPVVDGPAEVVRGAKKGGGDGAPAVAGAEEEEGEEDGLEDDGDSDDARRDAILQQVLDGRERPRKKHHPYLRIVLSPRPLADLNLRHPAITHQPPPKTRSRKRRTSKRKATATAANAKAAAVTGEGGAAKDSEEKAAEAELTAAMDEDREGP